MTLWLQEAYSGGICNYCQIFYWKQFEIMTTVVIIII